MRIAAISDIHGNLAALDAVLADIARRGADVVVNLGDLLSGPLQPCATAERLMALDLPTVAGNHERQVLTHAPARMGASDRFASERVTPAQRAWMATLPATLRLGDDVLLVHGTPTSDLTGWLETVTPAGMRPATHAEVLERAGDARAGLLLCGHTHVPRALRLDDGRLVVNPGSVGLQAYDDPEPWPHRMENSTPHARYALVERSGTAWSVSHIAVVYDWDGAAALAERHGAPDWAHALRTGRMPDRDTLTAGR
ncbi:metallophosphoesterase family protein [Pseudoduganella chitinolytica]|uniref:Metallophosphoesterase family protein n=1 Tax=Pseudoduganella chitinolytica TaxID=34070 RepID=A0ABY8BFF4_9BURK|nr:metallophosphoesterase family protein [Pseudoduganella chitinolytica]WEF33457.1 metallophosphoesterase family protein [Pseudoduganella chitinolytica]